MITKGLISAGASKVYILGRRKEVLFEAAQYSPDKIIPIVADVTSKDSLLQAVDHVKQESGHINVLICNSGIAATPLDLNTDSVEEVSRRAMQQDISEWQNLFLVNITAVYFTAMAFLPLLDAGNKADNAPGRTSQVLVTSSNASFLRIPSQLGPYGPSKAGVTHLVKMMSGSLAPFNIRINAIAPGLFPSELAEGLIKKVTAGVEDVYGDDVLPRNMIPAGRIGRETDMAGSVVYMLSRAGAYLNGNVNLIDGGRVSQVPSSY